METIQHVLRRKKKTFQRIHVILIFLIKVYIIYIPQHRFEGSLTVEVLGFLKKEFSIF